MKSDKQTKFFIIIALILFAAVMLLLAAVCWGILPLSGFVNYLENGPVFLRILIGIGFTVLAVGLLILVFAAGRIGKSKQKGEMSKLTQNNTGTAYISSDAVSAMAMRLLKRNKQVKSATCSINPVEDGVTADVKLTAFSGGDLTRLCYDVQNSIKQEVESKTGIPVRNVSVAIVKTVEAAAEPVVEKRVN